MKTEELKGMKLGQTFVKFAGGKYEVCGYSDTHVSIYDEPPSKHIDQVLLSSCTLVKPTKTKQVKSGGGIGTEEFLKLLDNLDIEPILKRQVRKVKWLYDNSNKHTMVYCEKDIRTVISRLQNKIKELENDITSMHENMAGADI